MKELARLICNAASSARWLSSILVEIELLTSKSKADEIHDKIWEISMNNKIPIWKQTDDYLKQDGIEVDGS